MTLNIRGLNGIRENFLVSLSLSPSQGSPLMMGMGIKVQQHFEKILFGVNRNQDATAKGSSSLEIK